MELQKQSSERDLLQFNSTKTIFESYQKLRSKSQYQNAIQQNSGKKQLTIKKHQIRISSIPNKLDYPRTNVKNLQSQKDSSKVFFTKQNPIVVSQDQVVYSKSARVSNTLRQISFKKCQKHYNQSDPLDFQFHDDIIYNQGDIVQSNIYKNWLWDNQKQQENKQKPNKIPQTSNSKQKMIKQSQMQFDQRQDMDYILDQKWQNQQCLKQQISRQMLIKKLQNYIRQQLLKNQYNIDKISLCIGQNLAYYFNKLEEQQSNYQPQSMEQIMGAKKVKKMQKLKITFKSQEHLKLKSLLGIN